MADETSDDDRGEDDWGASWGTEAEPGTESESEPVPESEHEPNPAPEPHAGPPTASDDRTETDRTTETDRISIDLSRDPETDTTQGPAHRSDSEDKNEDKDDEDDPYAPEPSSTPIEAGDPSLENALFVALGALIMILVLARVVSIML
ncbi:cell-surface adhesin [Natrialba hulunbeirensis JCM 10989]|uniref:Cell-surface adhesin n=1 Tax=Natrialba hulunbeirensis JCM 10989 TaxID=1227493 RepID=L9ZS36_9EURY|nr:hypothetical protein [Natrialba hulunbeirensis]ELY89164.1 cell-surface adhesin [Natrialba hulunbeirensis JCM 10989]